MKIHEVLLCLICTAVLAVLCGAASGGRKALDAACRNNLQKIYRMAEKYSADNDGYIVRMLERPTGTHGVFWCDEVRRYAGNYRYFYCPADEKKGVSGLKQDDLLPIKYTRRYVSYGINGHLCGVHKREKNLEKISNVQDPSYVLYFGDSQTMFLRSVGALWAKDYYPVHNNTMMAVMADGHTENFSQKNLGTYGKFPDWKRDIKRWKNWKE